MDKPINKARVIGARTHEGSSIKASKKTKDRRGRKAKKGRVIVKVAVTLLPTEQQKIALENDLALFNYFYKDTFERLTHPHIQDEKDRWLSYNPKTKRIHWTFKQRRDGLVQTPRYVMAKQASIRNEIDWMEGCTYQVLHRATTNAFDEFLKPAEERRFRIDGNSYEAKLKYAIKNGFLFLKKYGEYIKIVETAIPRGTLETIYITKENGRWTAELEILEPYDKVDDIKEKSSRLECDTAAHKLSINPNAEVTFSYLSKSFSIIANKAISYDITSHKAALRDFLFYKEGGVWDKDLISMGVLAGVVRVKKLRKFQKPITQPDEYNAKIEDTRQRKAVIPSIKKKYFAMSEGFMFKDGMFVIPRWGIAVPVHKYRSLSRANLDYVVVYKTKDGWEVAGKRRKKHVFRDFKKRIRDKMAQHHIDLPF